jgi:hypothetical protein
LFFRFERGIESATKARETIEVKLESEDLIGYLFPHFSG